MNEITANNPNQPLLDESETVDPLARIEEEVETVGELDPADSVAVLAGITAELNRELDADVETP